MNRDRSVQNPLKKATVIHERQFGLKTIRVVQDNGDMFSVQVCDQDGKISVMLGPYPNLRKAIAASKRYEAQSAD